MHVEILGVPAIGHPPAFLGGVGGFSLHAEASPEVVRVGQEFEFRVKVTGPAAWGMSERPELLRSDRCHLGCASGPARSRGRMSRLNALSFFVSGPREPAKRYFRHFRSHHSIRHLRTT